MAGMYKTPGVYVEEIVKFPPSIAPVETAIPAFIGYTEKAFKIQPDDLLNVPTKIGSLAEYELYFGAGATPEVSEVLLDDNRNFISATLKNRFYMYDSLRLFYANQGGDCYIVSTSTYQRAQNSINEFTDSGRGIKALEKYDEPTILVFPDNSLLTTGMDYYAVYDTALTQCAELMDRVALLHVKEDDQTGTGFRSGTSIQNLKYGMAYTPWLEVNFPMTFQYRDFKHAIKIEKTLVSLEDLTDHLPEEDQKTTTDLIKAYQKVIAGVDAIHSTSKALANGESTLRKRFTKAEKRYLDNKAPADYMLLVGFFIEIARSLDNLTKSPDVGDKIKDILKTAIKDSFTAPYSELIRYENELKNTMGNSYTIQYLISPPTAPEWKDIFTGAIAPTSLIPSTAADDVEKMNAMLPHLRACFNDINQAWLRKVVAAAEELETIKHEGLRDSFPLYKTILTGLRNSTTTVPPSGAVAGIYSYVDRTRGVWKAPANVGIRSIIGPAYPFTASELEALNVDPTSGKSINAIRSFTGKGTLVFGARTLAGNDNEWRYVSVRRFFNFVEESCKKATEQFVFEPNDANTWVRIQGMIENFLTTLWRQGALQGVKTEHAFYVAVGLGKTMTPLDILEGRLIVEIGLAAVRPAEFIILKFSHKMPES